jgi:hypothetical protein
VGWAGCVCVVVVVGGARPWRPVRPQSRRGLVAGGWWGGVGWGGVGWGGVHRYAHAGDPLWRFHASAPTLTINRQPQVGFMFELQVRLTLTTDPNTKP